MSFETFQQLPSHNLNIPEFRPANIPAPPVYNTSETIRPLLQLAQYLSPEARAKRKAAVAKANYEYRLYTKGGDPNSMKRQTWWQTLRVLQARERELNARTDKLRQSGGGTSLHPDVIKGMKRLGVTHPPANKIDYTSDSTPPELDGGDTESDIENLSEEDESSE